MQNRVRRLRVVDHFETVGVAGNRRAAQAFQNAKLNFMRGQRVQPVKTVGKTLQGFARQAKNQVGVHMGMATADQPAQVVGGFLVVLLAGNALLHLGVEALNTNFKLQRAGRKLRNQGFQPVGQAVGHDFKMQKQVA